MWRLTNCKQSYRAGDNDWSEKLVAFLSRGFNGQYSKLSGNLTSGFAEPSNVENSTRYNIKPLFMIKYMIILVVNSTVVK